MKGTICRIDDRQPILESVCRLKKLGPVPISLTGSAFVLMAITLHRFSTPTPLWDVPERTVGSYYLKKGR